MSQINYSMNSSQLKQIQDLIEQEQELLTCGPECQKLKKSEKLKNNYINAQTNLIAAPDILKEAQRKFYVNAQGVGGYNEMIEEELKNKIEKIASNMSAEFEENIQSAQSLTSTYQKTSEEDEYLQELKAKYMKENILLANEIRGILTDIVTNDRKTYYQSQNMTTSMNWYYLYSIIYAILLVIFLGLMIVKGTNDNYDWRFKVFISVIFIIYPFIAYGIILRIIGFGQHVSSLLPKNIYKNL